MQLGDNLRIRKFEFTLEGTTAKELNVYCGLFIINGGNNMIVVGACSANTSTVESIINSYSGGYGTFSMSKDVWGKLTVSKSTSGTGNYTAYIFGY